MGAGPSRVGAESGSGGAGPSFLGVAGIGRQTTGVPAVVVASLDALQPEVGHQTRVEGRDYAVWLRIDGQVAVLDNACAHVGGPLVDGAIRDGCVICPWHGWAYDLVTGQRRTAIGPETGVRAFRAWIEGGLVYADLPVGPGRERPAGP